MPEAGKMSSASILAEPMMPNTSVTPLASRTSTNASDGVMRCLPVSAAGREVVTLSIERSLQLSFMSFTRHVSVGVVPAPYGPAVQPVRLQKLVTHIVPPIEQTLPYPPERCEKMAGQGRGEDWQIEFRAL